MKTKNSTYLILTFVLLILSAIGAYFLYQLYQERQTSTYNSTTVPKIELIPTDIIEPEIIDSPVTATDPTQITSAVIPTITDFPVETTQIPTQIPSPTLIPTTIVAPVTATSVLTYSSPTDKFSVVYSNTRKFYQDTEPSGNRYTFSNPGGNFAIHVSSSTEWSWTHPRREFSNALLVAGKPTFKYDTDTQTLVDVQSETKNYTIQCVHNGVSSLKTECTEFINSFKLI